MMSNESSLYGNYARFPVRFVSGDGCWLRTDTGDEYLDFSSGIAVMSLGHGHPAMVSALQAQSSRLWHVSNLYEVPEQERLGRLLCDNSFADKVFFTNSGAEASECAIKTARRYQYDSGFPDRFEIITFSGAFHGRTLATLAATGNEKYLEGFGPTPDGFIQVPFNDEAALKSAVSDKTAAIFIEPIQGEGGLSIASSDFLRFLRVLCDEHGILLIYDEVQCGMGRTGKLFAHEWSSDCEPDIMTLAKGIGGGFPLGACLAKGSVAKVMVPGTHGSTYGGNPLAASMGIAVFTEVMSEGFLESVQLRGNVLRQGMSELLDKYPDHLSDIRGQGLLTGFGCKTPNTDIVAAFRAEKLLTVPAGDNTIRLIPPLTISDEEIRDALSRIDSALSSLS